MNEQESRACPFCAEAIKAKAKLCPRCRQWLTIRSFRHPVTCLFLFVVPMMLVLFSMGAALLMKLDRIQNPKPNYSEFSGSLKVLESRMNWAQARDGLRIYVTGVLTNQSPNAWKDLEFDCRFFDRNGLLIDASNGRGSLTIGANDDSAFRVSIVPTAPTNDYASFKISVSTARNGKSWF